MMRAHGRRGRSTSIASRGRLPGSFVLSRSPASIVVQESTGAPPAESKKLRYDDFKDAAAERPEFTSAQLHALHDRNARPAVLPSARYRMVASPAEDEAVLACLASLEAFLAGAGALPDSLAHVPPRTLEAALEALARRRGAEALPLVTAVAEGARTKAARRVLYRLEQAGVTLPRAAPRPVVQRGVDKALSAWVSAVDGSGSRAVWILFESAFGGWALCALIVNDQAGVL